MGSSTQDYVEILEKTNQQLSLWYNPYGLMVGILTALVALLAILFAFILWRQGKDYKDAFKAFLDEQKKIADGAIGKAILDANKVLEEQILKSKKQLSDIKDLKGEARERLESEIEELKKTKKSLEGISTRPYFGGVSSVYSDWTASTTHNPFRTNASVAGSLDYNQVFKIPKNNRACGFCGAQNPVGAQFCISCGQPQG